LTLDPCCLGLDACVRHLAQLGAWRLWLAACGLMLVAWRTLLGIRRSVGANGLLLLRSS
jgi:hypothetical protein